MMILLIHIRSKWDKLGHKTIKGFWMLNNIIIITHFKENNFFQIKCLLTSDLSSYNCPNEFQRVVLVFSIKLTFSYTKSDKQILIRFWSFFITLPILHLKTSGFSVGCGARFFWFKDLISVVFGSQHLMGGCWGDSL